MDLMREDYINNQVKNAEKMKKVKADIENMKFRAEIIERDYLMLKERVLNGEDQF